MKIKRRKQTLIIDWEGNECEKKLFVRQLRGSTVMVLPTRRKTAYVYGFNVFSELVTARHLMTIMEAVNALKYDGHSVYVSSQARTIFKRINDIKRLENERKNFYKKGRAFV